MSRWRWGRKVGCNGVGWKLQEKVYGRFVLFWIPGLSYLVRLGSFYLFVVLYPFCFYFLIRCIITLLHPPCIWYMSLGFVVSVICKSI